MHDIDVALVVVDVSKMPSAEDERVAQMLKSAASSGQDQSTQLP
ncbi:MAG: hypothetical protein R2688_03420 [Fimbriimonadaceae bacterium]